MTVKLLTEYNLRFLSLKEDCTGSFESTLVKMSHCWNIYYIIYLFHNLIDFLGAGTKSLTQYKYVQTQRSQIRLFPWEPGAV